MEAGVGDERRERDVLDSTAAGSLVIRGSLMRTAGYVLGIGLSVGAVAILIRALGAASYGRYVTVISLVTLVASVAEAGMTNLGIREYTTRTGADRERLMGNLLALRLSVSLLGVAVAVLFALVAGYTGPMVVGTALAGIAFVVANLQAAYSVPLSARLALGRVTALELVRHATTLALTVALAAAGAGLVAFLSIPLPASLAAAALTIVIVRGAIPLMPRFERGELARLLRLTASFALVTAVGTIYVYAIVIVMSLLTNARTVGYFGASYRVFVVLASIAGLLVTSAFPLLARAARDDRARLAYALQRLFEVSLIGGAWLAMCTVLGARVAIDVIAGHGFGPAVGTLRIQGAAIFASFLLATWGFALISLHRHRALLVANALGLAASVTACALLVPGHGAHGAAVATVIGESCLAAAYLIALVRGNPELRPRVAVAGKVALACGAGFAVALLPGLAPIPAVAAASVTYFGIALALRAIPDELLTAARAWRRART